MMAHQPRPSRYASSTSQCGRGHALDQGFSWPVCQLYLVVDEPTGWRWAQGVIRCVFSVHPARSATLGAAAFEGAREERLLAVRSRGGGARRRRESAVRAMQPTGFPYAAGRGSAAWASPREGAPAWPEADAGARRRREAAACVMRPGGLPHTVWARLQGAPFGGRHVRSEAELACEAAYSEPRDSQ